MLVELDPQWRCVLSTRELVLITRGLRRELTASDIEEATMLATKINKGRVGSTKTVLKQADILMENLIKSEVA